MYKIMHIYIEDMCTKKVGEGAVTSEPSILVKIANSNFVPTLRGFCWYPYFFVAQEQLVAFEAKEMTPAVASERSVFNKNHDYNV